MTMRKKLLITIACLSCILCIMVTGTIAWLIDDTETITNTFTPSNITVNLAEENHDTDYKFQMIPGKTYSKDPKVEVTTDIPCYVFIKVEENLGAWAEVGKTFSDYFTYSVRTSTGDWTAVPGTTGVYYFKADAGTTGKYVLTGNTDINANGVITVKGDAVTKAMMEALINAGATQYPTLKFTAYAIQQEGFNSAELAWAAIPNT